MNESMNKILVLGNGFDLAHYLPTKYNHFMTAMQAIVKSQNKEITFDELFADYLKYKDDFFLKAKELYKTDEFKLSNETVVKFKEKLENNAWFKYFVEYLKNTSNGIETWIDFENEIESVLSVIIKVLNQQDGNDIINNNIVHSDEYRLFAKHINKDSYISILSSFEIMFFYTKNNSHYASSHIDILNRYSNRYTSFNLNKIFNKISEQLNDFKYIFSLYISEIIDKLQPKKSFKIPEELELNLDDSLSAVFTFNYSESFQRFYDIKLGLIDKVQHLHGNAKVGNIVLGIDDLNDELRPYKIYNFVKTHQKIINNTDYQFLDDVDLSIKGTYNPSILYSDSDFMPYEIIIWGHSLDVSDKEYIWDIFDLNNGLNRRTIYLTIWHYGEPHNSLANLIHIMGKDIIQNWVKKGWLKFEKMPDIYALNKSDEKEN